MFSLPQEPNILLSYVNTQLRDFYPSLDEMCASLCVQKEEIIERLAKIDYIYHEESNRFV